MGRTLHHQEIWKSGYSAAQVCHGPAMRIVVLFQGASCATHVQRVIVLSTEALVTMALVRQKEIHTVM